MNARSLFRLKKYVVPSFTLVAGLVIGIVIGGWKVRGLPFISARDNWSIGMLKGSSPFDLTSQRIINNPVLTNDDVTDIRAEYVADPFMILDDSNYYMFFEVLNKDTAHGDIGLAESNDGMNWEYKKIVLDEPFHLSYPYVFKWDGEYYLIPESFENASVRLYKASEFPTQWDFVANLLEGYDFVDPSIFRFSDRWWLFLSSTRNDVLFLYYADDLIGPWVEHPESPIIDQNPNKARPGGRVLVTDNKVFRFTQDDYPTYGNQVNAFEITELSTTTYNENPVVENPILRGSGIGWNADGMHHIDPYKIGESHWIASVDGRRSKIVFGPNY